MTCKHNNWTIRDHDQIGKAYCEDCKELVNLGVVLRDVSARLKEATNKPLEIALALTEADPHQFSSRPCTTCGTIARLIGRPFGCTKLKR